jgi:RNA 3'-terminal phosphate cyclase (ATP)
MIEIDGSYGEGGGQILRTALSLSSLLKEPFRIVNIRKNRKKPGLQPQHLMAVKACAEITGARLDGAFQGSTELIFEPGQTRFGRFEFDIGTAGSTSLLLQALLLPLVFSGGSSELILKGGTHVPMSPPFDYINEVFLPTLQRLGVKCRAEIDAYGFYPRGGGLVRAFIEPSEAIVQTDFISRGNLNKVKLTSAVCGLPVSIAERQRDAALEVLKGFQVETEIKELHSFAGARGTFVFILASYENSLAGFSAIGERGKRAEAVGAEAAYQLLEHGKAGEYALDPHLADQVVLYLALTQAPCSFTTSQITEHLCTNLWVLERFLRLSYKVEGEKGGPGRVMLG